MTAAPRWRKRPRGSNWGDWGPDDQCGRLNLLTPEKVLQGIAEVREGRSFCLSLPLDRPGGVEAVPARADLAARVAEPLHEHCIFKLGIHLGELWTLSELNAWLKAHRRPRFLLTAPPLRLPGAAGSPVTPIATV